MEATVERVRRNVVEGLEVAHTVQKPIRQRDVVCLRDEPMTPTKWPLVKIIKVDPGKDGKIRVVTVQTAKGIYKRPVVKMVPLVLTEV